LILNRFAINLNAKTHWKYYLLLIITIIVIYWPVSTFSFALKNDALAGYFPARYFIADAFHHSIIPWWNPYINYGYPMHADLTSGFWNPVTWLLTLIGGYTVYSVHLEFLLYCILAAVGMFSLCTYFKQHIQTAFIIALCYACGGIFTGNAQHTNWLSAAAFLPFLLKAWLHLIKQPGFNEASKLSLWASLFIVSAHPNFIITDSYILLALLFLFIRKSSASIKHIITHLFISLILTLLVTGGFFYSVIELLPELTRSSAIKFTHVRNPFPLSDLLSFILPYSSTVSSSVLEASDLSMRNGYLGLMGLIFLLTTFVSVKNYYQKMFLFIGAVFLLLSFGTVLTLLATKYIPGLGYIRLVSTFRLPAMFFLLLASSFTLDRFIRGELIIQVKYVLAGLIGLIIILVIISLFHWQTTSVFPTSFNRNALKDWVSQNNFSKSILIQGTIQLPLLLLLLWKIKKPGLLFLAVCVIDLFLAVSLNAPYTIVGKMSVKDAQQLLEKAPKGFPKPELKPIIQNTSADNAFEKTFGNWSMYSKELGCTSKAKTYPSFLKTNEKYFNAGLNSVFIHSPFAYIAQTVTAYKDSIPYTPNDAYTCFIKATDIKSNLYLGGKDSTASLQPTKILPNHFSFETNCSENAILVLKQNYYKYWEGYEDGKRINIIPCNYTFMAVPVNNGKHTIDFIYNPWLPKILGIINLFTFFILLLYLVVPSKKK
jgi:hypothetical protein